MAEQLVHGDEINVGIEQILVNGTPPGITSGTGITWGMTRLRGAHTPCTSMKERLDMCSMPIPIINLFVVDTAHAVHLPLASPHASL
jgi:hypothetical protein